MLLKNLVRSFSLNNKLRQSLTSNFEVVNEISKINEQTISDIAENINVEKYKRTGHSREQINKIELYFNSKPSLRALKHIIPASLLKKASTTNKTKLVLVDKEVACDIFNVLRPHFETYNGHVLEINAGPGVLTEEFLKYGQQNLRIYESEGLLCNHLLQLIKRFKSDARLFKANLLALGGIMALDNKDPGNRFETLFDGLPFMNWNDEPVLKLIGTMPNEQFIRHIMFSITLQHGLCQFGRPELFLIFLPEDYKKLKSKPSDVKTYRSSSVLFQNLFDDEQLAVVPEDAFIPWRKNTKPKKRKNQSEETYDHMCLVRVTVKKDLLQTIPPNLLKTYWFFVKFLMRKKAALLIDTMEKWVPGSGVRLISKGYTIFTDCGSLTPEEYLQIYLEFISWPEFYSSSFIPSTEDLLRKILHYNLLEEVESDGKFHRLLNEESSNQSDDIDVFDGSSNLEREQNVCANKRGG